MIDYRIDLSQASAHRFVVTLKIARPDAQTWLSLPAWIPGSYLIREFSRHLTLQDARQGKQPCPIEQVDKATWVVHTVGKGALTVQYEVYANDPSVRAAFLDQRRGFFNGTSLCLSVAGQMDAPHRIALTGLPKGWEVATAMPALDKALHFEAADYDELVDHPFEMGTFWRQRFQVRGVAHELVVAGHHPRADLDRLLKDTQAICQAEIEFWHGRRKPPFKHYVFMLNVVEDGYGGLEHRGSTALICSRKDLPEQGVSTRSEGYTTLLGLISHEYFHTWNVKRLKPREFEPYDYAQENYTQLLWFFEGFTSYYDDLLLLRSGLVQPAEYIKLLNKPINQVLSTPGRLVQSVAQASMDAWIRYYRQDENTANATVSYYTKGSLVALCLDLALRQGPSADHGRSPCLDGVMRRLWSLQRAITEDDVADALTQEATAPPPAQGNWAQWLHSLVHGTQELPVSELLASHGVQWTPKPPSLTQQWGLRTREKDGALWVAAVMRHSPAEAAGLSAGDELLALNGWRLKKTEDLKQWRSVQAKQALLMCRDQQLQTVHLPRDLGDVTGWGDSAVISLMNADQLSADQARRQRAWLNQS